MWQAAWRELVFQLQEKVTSGQGLLEERLRVLRTEGQRKETPVLHLQCKNRGSYWRSRKQRWGALYLKGWKPAQLWKEGRHCGCYMSHDSGTKGVGLGTAGCGGFLKYSMPMARLQTKFCKMNEMYIWRISVINIKIPFSIFKQAGRRDCLD